MCLSAAGLDDSTRTPEEKYAAIVHLLYVSNVIRYRFVPRFGKASHAHQSISHFSTRCVYLTPFIAVNFAEEPCRSNHSVYGVILNHLPVPPPNLL